MAHVPNLEEAVEQIRIEEPHQPNMENQEMAENPNPEEYFEVIEQIRLEPQQLQAIMGNRQDLRPKIKMTSGLQQIVEKKCSSYAWDWPRLEHYLHQSRTQKIHCMSQAKLFFNFYVENSHPDGICKNLMSPFIKYQKAAKQILEDLMASHDEEEDWFIEAPIVLAVLLALGKNTNPGEVIKTLVERFLTDDLTKNLFFLKVANYVTEERQKSKSEQRFIINYKMLPKKCQHISQKCESEVLCFFTEAKPHFETAHWCKLIEKAYALVTSDCSFEDEDFVSNFFVFWGNSSEFWDVDKTDDFHMTHLYKFILLLQSKQVSNLFYVKILTLLNRILVISHPRPHCCPTFQKTDYDVASSVLSSFKKDTFFKSVPRLENGFVDKTILEEFLLMILQSIAIVERHELFDQHTDEYLKGFENVSTFIQANLEFPPDLHCSKILFSLFENRSEMETVLYTSLNIKKAILTKKISDPFISVINPVHFFIEFLQCVKFDEKSVFSSVNLVSTLFHDFFFKFLEFVATKCDFFIESCTEYGGGDVVNVVNGFFIRLKKWFEELGGRNVNNEYAVKILDLLEKIEALVASYTSQFC